MRKIYLFTAFVFITVLTKAQTFCDTINLPTPSNWTMQSYTSDGFFGMLGYISGINSDNFTIQANSFNLSSTSYAYLLGVMVKFTKANSNQPDNMNKMVYFRLYADNNGIPGTEITTDQTRGQATLASINSDVAKGNLTGINFPSPIALPASKKFYVGVDMSNFLWFSPQSQYDSICIATTGDNETANAAWNFDADPLKWKPYNKVWGTPPNELEPLDATLYIFPYVSTTAAGCSVLPVKLSSFTAQKNATDVVLKWQVENEINMTGYEVEKAGNNNVFRSIGFVTAHNDLKAQNYTLTDANAFAGSATVQYRLKQIDADGKIEYSKTITLNNDNPLVSFANPFTGALTLQLNVKSPQTIAISLFDAQGKLLLTQKPVVYSTSTINRLNGTEKLNPGTYFLNIVTGDKQYTYKVLKQ